MKLTYTQLSKSKDLEILGSWVLFSGPEEYLKREALARMRERVVELSRPEEPTWEILDGATIRARDLLNRSHTSALFGGARVVIVLQAERIDGDEQATLAKAVAPLPADVAVIFVTSGENAEPSRGKRTGIRTALQRAIEGHGLVIDFPNLNISQAAHWAIARAKEKEKKLQPAAAQKLVEQRVGANLGELEAEIEKLVLFAGDDDIITGEHVDQITPRLLEEDIFKLTDAISRQEAGHAVTILRTLLRDRRENPTRVLGMIASHIRLIWQVKLLTERGWRVGSRAPLDEETIALLPMDERKNVLKQLSRKSWLIEKTARQVKAFSWVMLTRAMEALTGCDLAIKGIQGKINEPEFALEMLVVQLCTGVEMPVWESSPSG